MIYAIAVNFPYRHNGTWVFDDEVVKLIRESFVSGIPEMIDILVQDISNILNCCSRFCDYLAE
jgi:predicted component of type VI protein secretion system